MKKIKIVFFISILLGFYSQNIQGQEDSITIENSSESVKESDYKKKRKYRYLDNNYREERTLFKLGTVPFNFGNLETSVIDLIGDFEIILSVEKKVSPSFSIILDNGFRFHPQHRYSGLYYFSSFGARYYHSMNKRIRTSTGVNNFHGNYFSITIDEWAKYGSIHEDPDNAYLYYPYVGEDWTFNPYINLSYGMQRRINRLGFVDIGPYFKFNQRDFGLGLNLSIGLACGLKK